MDIRTEKLNLIRRLIQVNDEDLINAIKSLLEYGLKQGEKDSTVDFWDELSEDQKNKIEASIKEINEGNSIPHHEVMAEFKKRYSA